MTTVTLGKTGITVNKNGFGALPIQRITKEEAAKLLRKAYDGGITYFDTARAYSDSEEKIGYALSDVRNHIYLATKTAATTAEGFWKDLETSLRLLKTDCIDVYQFHNPAVCPKPGDESGLYDAALKARKQGKIRFISITNHRLAVANEAVDSGLYATLQFPFCYLCSEKDLELVEKCKKADMGFIAMKALSGGLINNSRAAYAFQAQYDSVLPIWGVQKEHELDEFLSYIDNPPVMDDEIRTLIENDRKQLFGSFCRACGYCMPCPHGVDIPTCFAAYNTRYTDSFYSGMKAYIMCTTLKTNPTNASKCRQCGKCEKHCPQSIAIRQELKQVAKKMENPVYKVARAISKRIGKY